MKITKKKVFVFIGIILFIINSIMVIKFFTNSYKYSKYYNYINNEIVNFKNFNNNEMLSSTEVETNDKLESIYLRGYSGVSKYEDVELLKDEDVKINKKIGKVKIILEDKNKSDNNIIVLDNVKKENKIPKGEYNVIIVGKWFTGKIIFKKNNGL